MVQVSVPFRCRELVWVDIWMSESFSKYRCYALGVSLFL